MRTPFTSSRAMALTLALDAWDDGFTRAPYRARRRVRRTRGRARTTGAADPLLTRD